MIVSGMKKIKDMTKRLSYDARVGKYVVVDERSSADLGIVLFTEMEIREYSVLVL